MALLLVESDTAEHRDTPGGRIASVLAFARARLTGEPPRGDIDTVELGTP